MNKVLIAVSMATLGLWLNSAVAQDVKSANVEARIVYKEARQDCGLLHGIGRDQCLADARANYLSSEMRCESSMGSAKEACLKQAEAAESRALLTQVNRPPAAHEADID
jgi:hypothetical protein